MVGREETHFTCKGLLCDSRLQGPSLSLRAALGEGEMTGPFLPPPTLWPLLDTGQTWGRCSGSARAQSLCLSPGARCVPWAKVSSRSAHVTKIYFPQGKNDRNGLSLSESWFFSRRRQAKPRQAQRSSQRSPRKLVGGQSGVRLPSPVPGASRQRKQLEMQTSLQRRADTKSAQGLPRLRDTLSPQDISLPRSL